MSVGNLYNRLLGLLHRAKYRLGIFRIPIGTFFLIVTLFLIITPLTPGSMVTLFIGLELLDMREYFTKRYRLFRNSRGKYSNEVHDKIGQ